MLAIVYVDLGLAADADAWVREAVATEPDATMVLAAQSYRFAHAGEIQRAQAVALRALADHRHFDRWWGGFLTMRLAVDALLERNEAEKAVDMILAAEPDWAAFAEQSPQQSPQVVDNPGFYNSGAVRLTDYLPDFARALFAAGNAEGARNVLTHHERFIDWRRKNGFVVWETNAAELHALRGESELAIDALEAALQNGTILAYADHKFFRNRIFDNLREVPRFRDVDRRIRAELARHRASLESR